jgi:hypothetical protein
LRKQIGLAAEMGGEVGAAFGIGIERLRDELKFDSVDALVEQIDMDVDETRNILKERS